MRFLAALAFLVSTNCWSADLATLQLLSKKFPPLQASLFRNLKDQPMDKSYEFDANRSPEEALKDGLGGQCNMHARVAALALMRNGVPAQNIRIVSAVNNSSLDRLCSGRKGKAAANSSDSLTGHVFLLIKSGSAWYLVNTTTVPGTPPAQSYGRLGLEYTQFMSPNELDARMAEGPTALPNEAKKSLPPEIFGDMTIFSSVRPDKYPLNDFAGRRKLVASGSLTNDKCRYDGSANNFSRSSPARAAH